MNLIAEQLIHNLRYDAHTREHFSIRAWDGKGSCDTIGCIAGTALVLAGNYKITLQLMRIEHSDIIEQGQKVLGIPYYQTAAHLFMPSFRNYTNMSYLPVQARPDLDTVEKMKKWAEKENRIFNNDFTPDRCALALERIVKDEIPYCDWSYAFEHA